ncbi:MAG: hypothetical protein HZC54_21220, partial [Verrucomicrobia bacterium]|nr:hypothetical protein [Verrucomicrobiota bacterium]
MTSASVVRRTRFFTHTAALCLAAAIAHIAAPNASAETGVTNIVNGVPFNATTYFLGSNGAFNALIVTNAGVLTVSDVAIIGNTFSSSSNRALVTGVGSVCRIGNWLAVGYSGSGNSLILTNGGQVFNAANGLIGTGPASGNNSVLVTGAGSVWSNGTWLAVGNYGSNNKLTIANGGRVLNSSSGVIGSWPGANNNSMLVTGAGSVWSNSGWVAVGFDGSGNSMILTNGGKVFNISSAAIGVTTNGNNNSVLVAGAGSVWNNAGWLSVGHSGSGNTLSILDGGQVFGAGPDAIGSGSNSTYNGVLVSGAGSVWSGSGDLDIGGFGSFNSLTIASGGQVFTTTNGTVGRGNGTRNNAVLVTGAGSFWSNSSSLAVGVLGHSNRLTIASGAHVFNGSNGLIGAGFNASNNSVLVTGAGSSWSNGTSLTVGNFGSFNSLTIADSGQVFSADTGFIGGWTNSKNNSVLVTGTGSLWNIGSSLAIGNNGSSNRLTIANGGQVFNTGDGMIGAWTNANGSSVLVSGPGSVWSNGGSLAVGNHGSYNSLSIAGGGQVFSATNGAIGGGTNANGNSVLVSGVGSVWSFDDSLDVGNHGSFNNLTIADGGQVFTITDSSIGGGTSASNNWVMVTGAGSVWANFGSLFLGYQGSGSSLTIANGGLVAATDAAIGYDASSGSLLTVSGGSFYAVNADGTGTLDVHNGALALNSGTVVVDLLSVTNFTSSVVNFNGGTLDSGGSLVDNGSRFQVGNGASAADLHLSGGAHVFVDGLLINTNATLNGSGVILGRITNAGTIAPGDSIGIIIDDGDLTLLGGATMSMELGGTNTMLYDEFDVTGALNFGGSLSVSLLDGFTPSLGDWFDLFDFGAGLGAFNLFNLPSLDPSLYWNTSSLYTSGEISVDLTPWIASPANGSTLSSTSVTFAWDAGAGVSQYALWVGSTPNSYDLHALVVGTNLSQVLTLPATGRPVYVRLWSQVNGTWQYTDSSYMTVSPVKAAMTSPANGSTNSSASVTFAWDAGVGAGQYALWVGSASNSSDLHALVVGTNLSQTLTLPVDGRSLYVRLWSQINGAWQWNDYAYTAYTAPTPVKAAMVSPAAGTTNSSASVTFAWDAGVGASQYALWVGSASNGYDLHALAVDTNLSQTLTLPVDGRSVYVRLWSQINGAWQWNDYAYTAFTAPVAKAAMLSPLNGSTNSSASMTFTWDAGVRASQYAMWVGSASNGYDLFASVLGTNLTRTVTGLPVDGRNLFVRLWSCINNVWDYNDYSYRALNTVKARFTGLSNGATLGSANVTLTWDAGAGASQYALWVGSAAGGHDLYAAVEGANLSRALTMPADGRRLYVRLWSLINGSWKQNDYMFTAYTAPTTRAEMISPTNGTVLVSNPVT